MSSHNAEIHWSRGDQPFTDNRYSRVHHWRFDGGIDLVASSSPSLVPLPMSSAEAVDPEEAFVASLSSCHMLWFLSLAAKGGFRVDTYRDQASGVMGKNAEGKLAMLSVHLRPEVTFSGPKIPNTPEQEALHHKAHELCFLASSVKSEITCEPGIVSGSPGDTQK